MIGILLGDGWFLVNPKGTHSRYKHSAKKGRVTVAGALSEEVHPKTLKSIFRQAGWRGSQMRYSVVIEKGEKNYSAYLPDVPGCIATGRTPEITLEKLAKALEMHLAGLREDGLSIPEPNARVDYVTLLG